MFADIFSGGIVKRAIEKGLMQVNAHNLRDYATDKHHQVDDRPFGGSPGMVLKPEPIFAAVEKIRRDENTPVFLLSPQGRTFNSSRAEGMALSSQVILICGRYEGVDERVIQHLITDEISIGDYILSGGEPAAAVVVDAVSRFIPGVVGKMESVERDSFFEGLLDCPHYTRPRNFRGMTVPEILISGNHAEIAEWRREKAREKTRRVRPDLLEHLNNDKEGKSS
jgi:tRNA (guanine37-N1)-methyltransferase